MMRAGIVAAGLMVCVSSNAVAASLQEEFNAAQAAVEKGDFPKAVAGFEKVLAQLPDDPKNRTVAVIRSRLGSARLALFDYEGAIEVLEQALPGLSDANSGDDRQNTLYDLGKAREALLDYDAARQAFTTLVSELEANNTAKPKDLALYRIALARVSLFDDPDFARRQLDLALPVVESALDEKNDVRAEVYTLRGRAELMAGKLPDANSWFEKALAAAGGLGTKVTLSDVRIRGDLALAAQLVGNDYKVRKYLAYTGAGRMGQKNPLNGSDMPLPACGDATGLKPDDAAVIEFAIGDDGQVVFVQPIYATRTGPMALEFARAVARWSWMPEGLKDTSKFWRSSVRLELRCTKQVERAGSLSALWTVYNDWLEAKSVPSDGVQVEDGTSAAKAVAQWRAALAEREAKVGKDDLSLLPLLVNLGSSPSVPGTEGKDLLSRAEAIAVAHDAPVEVRVVVKGLNIQKQPGLWGRHWTAAVKDGFAQLLAELREKNEAANQAGAWVQTMLATALERLREFDAAEQHYRDVLALPVSVLPTADPVRQLAAVRLASLKAAEKKFEEADGLLQATGLSPEQCELVDVRPVALNARMTSSDFPRLALSWGFEGWVKVSYDIDAEGRVVEPRTVIAYPPFIFGPSTEKAVSRFRYQPIYRAGEAIGCTGYEQGINYRLGR